MSDVYEGELEEVLMGTVEVRVMNCVLVIVEVRVAYEEKEKRDSRARERRMVMINNNELQ